MNAWGFWLGSYLEGIETPLRQRQAHSGPGRWDRTLKGLKLPPSGERTAAGNQLGSYLEGIETFFGRLK